MLSDGSNFTRWNENQAKGRGRGSNSGQIHRQEKDCQRRIGARIEVSRPTKSSIGRQGQSREAIHISIKSKFEYIRKTGLYQMQIK